MNNPIVFFDSGIGGVPYLVHLRARLPFENFIYIADSKNFPYGNKNEDDLKNIVLDIIDNIIKVTNPKVVVIACNTASVTALDDLRKMTNIPIVGVVPAIKTAAMLTENNRIGILATKRTVNGSYLKNLIKDFSSQNSVYSVGASEIVEFVENDLYHATGDEVDRFIKKSVSVLKDYDVDCVVLGCTHFIHIANEIGVALGNHVRVIDSREGVSKQAERVLILNNPQKSRGYAYFYMTKELKNSQNYRSLCDRSELEFKGEFIRC